MKNFSIIVLVSFAICVNAGIDKEKAKEMAKVLVDHCKTQEGGSDADVETMMNLKYPESDAGRCMIACIHEKMGFVSILKWIKLWNIWTVLEI